MYSSLLHRVKIPDGRCKKVRETRIAEIVRENTTLIENVRHMPDDMIFSIAMQFSCPKTLLEFLLKVTDRMNITRIMKAWKEKKYQGYIDRKCELQREERRKENEQLKWLDDVDRHIDQMRERVGPPRAFGMAPSRHTLECRCSVCRVRDICAKGGSMGVSLSTLRSWIKTRHAGLPLPPHDV